MGHNDDDKYIVGTYLERRESPEVECQLQEQLHLILRRLMETKGLYQNERVDDSIFVKYQTSKSLKSEFSKRPIDLYSRIASDGTSRDTQRNVKRGYNGIQLYADGMILSSYVPNINILCTVCKSSSSFICVHSINHVPDLNIYPKSGNETEQLYSLMYQCPVCRDSVVTYQILRKGLKFQITGRSSPYRPIIENVWPKHIVKIIEDARIAVAEGDISAGYYHLRTALEFYLKSEIKIAYKTKVDGVELCEKYNSKQDHRLKDGFPSPLPIYAKLSEGMHSREVSAEEFELLQKQFHDHLFAKKLFSEYRTHV